MSLISLHSQSVDSMSACSYYKLVAELNHYYSQSMTSSITQLSYGMMFASLNIAIHTITKLAKGTLYLPIYVRQSN